jgi:CheY-like chemotaxis protein
LAKILVVDDEPNNRLLLAAILEPIRHEVLEASNGADALQLARRERPDLIIIDLQMPGMDGAQFLKEIRVDDELKDVKVALYTATVTNPDLAEFMELTGVKNVIPKPCEPRDVLALVSAILSNSTSR